MAAGEANRRDHFSPRGYLRGFIHPERRTYPRPLWVFDVQRRRWAELAPKAVGFETGYYDYSPDSRPDATAEDSFVRMERDFPLVRDRIRREGHATWIQHRELLVSFAAMMAARSPMFRTQAEGAICEPLQASAEGAAVLAKNYAITLMRTQIEARCREWLAWDWALGYSVEPANPVITCDQPVGMWGNQQDQANAVVHSDFWVWCPLSWDMCLIGSSKPLADVRTAELNGRHLSDIRRRTRAQAARFVVSPVPVEE